MKTVINTQSNLAKFVVAASFFALGWRSDRRDSAGAGAHSCRGTRGTHNGQLVGDVSRTLFGP